MYQLDMATHLLWMYLEDLDFFFKLSRFKYDFNEFVFLLKTFHFALLVINVEL